MTIRTERSTPQDDHSEGDTLLQKKYLKLLRRPFVICYHAKIMIILLSKSNSLLSHLLLLTISLVLILHSIYAIFFILHCVAFYFRLSYIVNFSIISLR